MGVMSCRRNDCNNVMCDTYVDGFGYICWECQNEFKEYCKSLDSYPKTEGQIFKALKEFKEIPKDEYREGKEIDIDHFFKERTRE